jgi:hypothetical protein
MDGVREAVGDLVEGVFASLSRIDAAAVELWDRLTAAGIAPRSGDLSALQDILLGEVHRHGALLNGAGLVMAEGVLADVAHHLEWWRAAPGRRPQKVRFDLNPNSEYFYDYSVMEWFVMPRDRDSRWVAGPYLDYTGVDLYICTFAVPVRSGAGRFLGIAGVDVTLAALDAALMPALRAGGHPVALVNAEGRVIVANHADHVTGSRLRGAVAAGEPVPGTQWALVDLVDLGPGPGPGQTGLNV